MNDRDDRFNRNEALFGAEGQRRIARTRVAIAGLGGLGSHVAQQLAYLGVRSMTLVDFDIVTASSLNRLIGAEDEDVAAATKKTTVAKRSILRIAPDAEVQVVDGRVADPEAARLLQQVDLVIGCLDRDVHRLELADACVPSGIPQIDLATDTGGEGHEWYGGRVVFSTGWGCLVCLGLLDQRQMVLDRMTPQEREVDRRIYGVDRDALRETGPSVVSINGVVASLAVTEFTVWVTGLRQPFAQLTYRADLGTVAKSLDPGADDCFYCASLRG